VTRTRVSLPALVLVLAACQSPAGPVGTEPGITSAPAASSPLTPAATAGPSVEVIPGEGVAAGERSLAAWQTRGLVDVRSGARFAIADLAGKVVVIEPMAIWCTNCARQQREASRALASLSSDEVVYVSLDVDPSERAEDLAAYAEEQGFDWRFAVADRAMSRALADAFGDQVLSPPSTPKILVAPDGSVEGPRFGIDDASAIEAELRSLLP
jgi:thiol-disulfide isomerase/thioredoxin